MEALIISAMRSAFNVDKWNVLKYWSAYCFRFSGVSSYTKREFGPRTLKAVWLDCRIMLKACSNVTFFALTLTSKLSVFLSKTKLRL